MRTETDGFRLNFLPDLSGISVGGRWFSNLRRGSRGQSGANSPSSTDGQPSPNEEEPQNVVHTFEQVLETQHLFEASQLLIEREERLFGEIMESEALQHHTEEVDKLAADYRDLEALVLQTVRLSFSPEEFSTEALTSAVNAVNQEEDQDRLWRERDGIPPMWRPGRWKKLHDSTLRSLVEERIDNPSTPRADQVAQQSSIQADVLSMGRQLKEDLLFMVEKVKSCYPSELDICNVYAKLYHQTLSTRLKKIADFGLDDKDCNFLLRWVHEFYPQILQKPELASEIDSEALGKLLPAELLKPLEEQYLSKQQEELTTYIGRVLDEAKQRWIDGKEPAREDGCYVSPVAYDIIQFVNGMVTSAEKTVGDLHKAQNIASQLTDLMQRFSIFLNEVIKQNKPNSKPIIKANLGCIEQFRVVLNEKRNLFPEEVREKCLLVLNEMKESAHTYLLKPVHEELKPQYRKLGTSDWLNKPLFEKLLVSIENEIQDLRGSIENCHQEMIGQLHQEVTAEYVRRLLKGKVNLADKDQQLKAYMTVKNNAESLHDLFVKMGSKEDWLKEILTKIAEVLKLQELPSIQMQVASLGTAFPDLSEKHVSALLKLKTNLSKADRKIVKDTLSDTLRGMQSNVPDQQFFSTVKLEKDKVWLKFF
ncbi:tumor necrosis factor alpha-induced protein 2 isoform X2 [Micropterus dolomieu]|nr:tumor necrosis factor alpha-induced protein 2 isoform X2 [Micropterus dolomieu]XP_045919635.1 tumor necrosis factor alpha-induced protein 2 isoform X2 [Micropterus dolomieu]XP_045919636.1 tumor necrosis factor alpha-induced protein 2 isoform X2 [Micropterus dolomieu]